MFCNKPLPRLLATCGSIQGFHVAHAVDVGAAVTALTAAPIAGIAVGAVVLVAILIGVGIYVYKGGKCITFAQKNPPQKVQPQTKQTTTVVTTTTSQQMYPDQYSRHPNQPATYTGQSITHPGQPVTYPVQPVSYPGQPVTYPGQPANNNAPSTVVVQHSYPLTDHPNSVRY